MDVVDVISRLDAGVVTLRRSGGFWFIRMKDGIVTLHRSVPVWKP